MAIKSRLRELVDQKAQNEGRKITYRDIKDETGGINLNTITAVMNDDWSLIGRVTIDRLCAWLEVQPGDLFAYTSNGDQPQ